MLLAFANTANLVCHYLRTLFPNLCIMMFLHGAAIAQSGSGM